MKKNSLVMGMVGWILLIAFVGPLQSAKADAAPQVIYTLQIDDPASHIMHVTVEVQNWAGPVTFRLMTYQDLTFTVSLYCSRETITFPWHYANLRAYMEDGTDIPVRLVSKGGGNRGDAVVTVSPQGAKHFYFAYDVIPLGGHSFGMLPGETHERLASYLGENFGVFFERYVLFLPANLPQDTAVYLRFQLPPKWVAMTPWAEESGGFATSLQVLRAPHWYWGGGIAVGPFEVRHRQIGHTDVRVAVASSIPQSDRETAFRVTFGTFAFIWKAYGDFPAPYFLAVVYDEPSEKTCYGGKHEGYPIMDLLRGDATEFIDYQSIQGISGPPGAPPPWQDISDEMSYLWMEMTSEGRDLSCWVLYQGNPVLYTYAVYQTGVWDNDWRNPEYHFVNPKVWFYYRYLDYFRIWVDDHWLWLYKEERALILDYEIQRRTLGYFHLWDVVGRIYREHTNPCNYANLIRTIHEVTGQDFSDWFKKYVFSPQAEEHRTQTYYKDSDHDGVWDWIEEDLGLDPQNPDTDGDGINDGAEMGLQWMLASSPDVSLDAPFSDPLSPDSPGRGSRVEGTSDTTQKGEQSPTDSSGASSEKSQGPSLITPDLSSAQIVLDGKVDEWPSLRPLKIDPKEENQDADITAFYLFKDNEYLYLRLDGRFPLNTYEQITFDLLAQLSSGKSKAFELSTETTEPNTVHLIPRGGRHLFFDQQTIYQGAAFSTKHYEAIIPLALLGGDIQDIKIHAYIVDQDHMVEDLPKTEQSWLLPTPTPKPTPKPTPTLLPSPTAPAPLLASPPPPPSSSAASQSSTYPRQLFWIVGAFLGGILTGYLSTASKRGSHV